MGDNLALQLLLTGCGYLSEGLKGELSRIHVQAQLLLELGDNLHGEQRMATKIQEIIVKTHTIQVQNLLPDFREQTFNLAGRLLGRFLEIEIGKLRCGESMPVQFSIWG